MSEVKRESGRRISFLTAAKSMERAFVGLASRLMQSSKYLILLVEKVKCIEGTLLHSPRRSCTRFGLQRSRNDHSLTLRFDYYYRYQHYFPQRL